MTIYESWVSAAYDGQGNVVQKLWDDYLPKEQKIYEDILTTKNTNINATVKELGEKYDMSNEYIIGFLDGISAALDTNFELNELEEESQINAAVNLETLYKKMVEYGADHLMDLPHWDNVYSKEERAKLYKEQRSSSTIKRDGDKIGRNDPCKCNSGKKYKKCCGING